LGSLDGSVWRHDETTHVTEADEKSAGPAGFILVDPYGNPVLVDPHV
jgi:hypothetical protein